MKFKKILMIILLYVQTIDLLSGPSVSTMRYSESSVELLHVNATAPQINQESSSNLTGYINAAELEGIQPEIIQTNQYSIINEVNTYEYMQFSAHTKIYHDVEIDDFVFKEIRSKFIKSIKNENLDKFNSVISIMDIYQLLKTDQGDTQNYVQALCNGDFTGPTKPLHRVAFYHKNIAIAHALLLNKADINLKDNFDKTALNYALQRKMRNNKDHFMYDFLLEHGGKTSEDL